MNHYSRKTFISHVSKLAFLGLAFYPFRKLFAQFKSVQELPSWKQLIEVARWCPSVHNLQPHKVKIISEREAELYIDSTRLLPIGDPQSIFATVAMGVFIEHLSIAASAYGMQVNVTKVFNPISIHADPLSLFATVSLGDSTAIETLSADLILKRKTSRGHYNGKALDAKVLNKIKQEAKGFGHEFFSSNSKELVQDIIKQNRETLFEDLASKENCEELNHLFRYSEAEAKLKKDGLWARCMGFPGSLMRSVFQHPKRWHQGLRGMMLAKHYESSFKGTATIGWFAGKFDHSMDWLNAGRMLARNWLIITQEKAYIQPFGSLITNKKAYQILQSKLTPTEDQSKKIWLLFRVGYSKEPTRSYRLTTDEIIIN